MKSFLGYDCFPSVGEEAKQKSKKKKKKNACFGFSSEHFRGGGGGERCAAARLGSSLCQGYKQAVIRPPNRIIPPVSAPKHMGPHKAAAAPDRHPLLITQRRGARPFLHCAFPVPASDSLRLAVEDMHSMLEEGEHRQRY